MTYRRYTTLLVTPFVPICSRSKLCICCLVEFTEKKAHSFSANDIIIKGCIALWTSEFINSVHLNDTTHGTLACMGSITTAVCFLRDPRVWGPCSFSAAPDLKPCAFRMSLNSFLLTGVLTVKETKWINVLNKTHDYYIPVPPISR